VFGTILFRLILWELLKVFLMSLVGITGILLMASIIAEATQQGLGPGQILLAIPLLVPSTMPYTIPATTLFATCVVYGRMTADNELLAIKAAGVNIIHVVKPALLLGVAISLLTVGLYFHVIPSTHRTLRMMIWRDAEQLLYSLLSRNQALTHSQLRYTMFVRSVKGRKLNDPIVTLKGAGGQTDVVARAREAELRVDTERRPPMLLIHMKSGVVTSKGPRGAHNEKESNSYFNDQTFEMPLPDGIGRYENRPRDMTWEELVSREEELAEEVEHWRALVADAEAKGSDAGLAPGKHLLNLKEKLWHTVKQRRLHYVERLMRLALSAGCLCFVLVGCPIGIWLSRSDYLSSFITCFLPIVLVYYPVMLCVTNLAKEGRVEPALIIWLADALVAVFGLVLFWRLLKN
jgi:lipopolysaccharide export system permease protein